MAVSRVVDGMIASSLVPRFHPASAPRMMPSAKLITVAVPTRASVQKMDWLISELTGVGKSLMDRPSCRWLKPSRYCQYFWKMLPVPRPSSFVRTWASPVGTVPDCCILLRMTSTGFPGMSCGSRKLMVSAAHAATR